MDNESLQELTSEIRAITGAVGKLEGKLDGSVNTLQAKIDNISNELRILSTVVRGNGHTENSLVSRMQAVETNTETLKSNLKELSNKDNSRSMEDRRGRWGILVALVVGFFSLTASVVNAFIK